MGASRRVYSKPASGISGGALEILEATPTRPLPVRVQRPGPSRWRVTLKGVAAPAPAAHI